MRVEDVPFEFPPPPPRSPGLHLSDIIREIERDILGPEARPDKTPDQLVRLQAHFEAGLLWERAFETAMRERYTEGRPWVKRQGEVEVDGVAMTPDALDTQEGVVEEYKWTRVSLATVLREGFDKKWPGYMMQLKAYCRACKTTKGKLIVYFVNGSYKWGTPEGDPLPKCWLFTFTRQELEENWLMILSKKREIEARGKGGRHGGADAGVRDGVRGGLRAGLRGLRLAAVVDRQAGARGGRPSAGRGGVRATAQVEAEGNDKVQRVPWLNFAALDEED